jgi:hypothetical protein
MKKNIVYLFTLLAVSMGIGIGILSCNKNNLNLTPVDRVSDDGVFSSTDPGLLTAFVNDIYMGLPHGFDWSMLASVTDEAETQAGTWAGMQAAMLSQITPSSLACFATNSSCPEYWHFNWTNQFSFIRATNLFFSKIDLSPVDTATKNKLKGEVFFLRAYLYHNLVSFYGGVPIITKAYTLTDSFSVARSSYASCVQFVSDQCDSAAQYLPVVQAQVGRATKGAALALKSRSLLYTASDLYNTPSVFAGYSNPELVSYTGASAGDRQTRWQKAKDAAKAVMNLGIYSLYMPNPPTAADASTNYGNLFLQQNTSEDIFIKYFTPSMVAGWNNYGKTYGPGLFHNSNGFWGWGVDGPTQQFVDEYEMSDGTAFNWSNPTHAAAPYKNRDPRFYATVLYDGAPWRQRTSDVAPYEPNGVIQTGYQVTSTGDSIGGWDTKNNPTGVNIWNAGNTGYYLRKTVDPTVDPLKSLQTAPWRYMRYTEILLNYAEACIGLGQEGEALIYINMVRARAAMPPISTSGAALVESLRHERKIELAFEELRYFDIRRWMICDPAVYGKKAGFSDVYAIHVHYPYVSGSSYGQGTPTYTVYNAEARAWDHKSYFLPIAYDEMNKNLKLIQNPFY